MRAGVKRSKPAATAVWVVKRFPARVAASATSKGCPVSSMKAAGALQHGKGRMPFIQVTDFRLDAERAQQSPAANPKQQFLLEAQLRPAAIQLAGNSSMSGEVRRVIAIQQVELHSTHLDLPGAQPNRVTRQGDLQPQPLAVRAGATA